MAEPYPYYNQIQNEPVFIFSIMLLQSAVSIILLLVATLVFLKYRQNHKQEVKDLALTFFFMGLSFVSATIPIFLAHVAPYFDLINGIPIFYENWHFWWTNITYGLMTISVLFLLRFINVLFEEYHPKIFYWIFLVLVIIFNIWNVYQGIYVHSTDITASSLPIIPWAILFLIIGVIPWVLLALFSRKLRKRIEPSVFRVGVKYIGLSAICTICSYLMFILRSEIPDPAMQDVMEFAYFIFFIFTTVLLYIGYTLPPWFKNRVEKQIQVKK